MIPQATPASNPAKRALRMNSDWKASIIFSGVLVVVLAQNAMRHPAVGYQIDGALVG